MSGNWNRPAALGCGTGASVAVGAVAGAVLVTNLAFRFLAARLGPLYDGTGESGLAAFLFVPAGAFWGAFGGPVALWLAVGLGHWIRSRDLVSQEAGTDILVSIGVVVAGVIAFVAGAAGFAFVLQHFVN